MTCIGKLSERQKLSVVEICEDSADIMFRLLASEGFDFCPGCALYWATAALVRQYLRFTPGAEPAQMAVTMSKGIHAAFNAMKQEEALLAAQKTAEAGRSSAALATGAGEGGATESPPSAVPQKSEPKGRFN